MQGLRNELSLKFSWFCVEDLFNALLSAAGSVALFRCTFLLSKDAVVLPEFSLISLKTSDPGQKPRQNPLLTA